MARLSSPEWMVTCQDSHPSQYKGALVAVWQSAGFAIGKLQDRISVGAILRTKVHSAFHPSGVGKWVPATAGKAKAGMAHSNCGWTCGCAGRTRAIPERFCGGASLRRGAISSVCSLIYLYLYLCYHTLWPRTTNFGMLKQVGQGRV